MKNKIQDPELFKVIKVFLTSYLPHIKKCSRHTVEAYKYALNIFFEYLSVVNGIPLTRTKAADFSQQNIVGFMEWLLNSRNNIATTANQRLTHLRGFCKYLRKNNLISFVEYEEICEIGEIADTRTPDFSWLSIEEIKMILEQPNVSKKTGVRDRFFLALLYESGCRDDEILHLKVKDFVVNSSGEPDIHIWGKGQKYRCTPISANILPYYRAYCAIYHSEIEKEQEELLFYTERNGIKTAMSSDNVQRFMRTYEKQIKAGGTEIIHLHPHLFRRTRAMHLYIAGVPLPLVSEWLGHSNEETTRIYPKATDEMKRRAQQKVNEALKEIMEEDPVFKYANDEDVLKKLSGLI